MARQIRWQVAFQSKAGVNCHVDIYDDGWTGGITQLQGTDNPFYYDEDDDDNLLSVVRSKTGYIEVIEQNMGDLAALYPDNNLSHYVEFYYDSIMEFCGYIQAQSFDNDIEPWKHVLHLPVVSFLGLAEDFKMNTVNPPRDITLGEMLADMLDVMQAPFAYVYIPRRDIEVNCWLSKTVNSLAVSPFNDDYSQVKDVVSPMFSPRNYREAIEGICNAFGLIVYEFRDKLVFRDVRKVGTYISLESANLRNIGTSWTTQGVPQDNGSFYNIGDFYTWVDNKANTSTIKPFQKITRKCQGDYVDNVELTFDRFKFYQVRGYPYESNKNYAFFTSETPEFVCSMLEAVNQTFDNYGYLTRSGVSIIEYADIDPTGKLNAKKKSIVIIPGSWSQGLDIFTYKFFRRPTGNAFIFSCPYEWGDKPSSYNQDNVDHYELGFEIKVGDMYYRGGGEWSTTRHFIGITATEFSVTNVPEGTIEVIVRYNQATGGSPQRLLSIGEMTLKEDQKIWSDYTVDKEQDAVINNTNGFGIGEETVDNLFSLKRKDSNSLRPDSNINPPTYPYLMQTQQRRVVRYALKALNLHKVYHPYILPWKDTDGTMYRIIARSFTPIDDEMTLVLHHSPAFTQ